MTYIVMECHPAFAVLMDEEGRFVKAANRHYEVGQTVCDPILMATPRNRFTPSLRLVRRAVLAMAACLLVVLGIAHFASTAAPYASVVMTINPSVRIDMDKSGNVTDTVALNDDGRTLLENFTGKNKALVAVTDELLDRAAAMGFLKENGTVSFSVSCGDEAQKYRYEQTLISHMAVLSEERHIAVVIEKSDGGSSVQNEATRITTVTTTTTITVPTKLFDDDDQIEESDSYIGRDAALWIVLDDIGVTVADVSEWDVELDEGEGAAMYGMVVYEVEVTVNDTEYNYTVDAGSGAIIDFEIEQETED